MKDPCPQEQIYGRYFTYHGPQRRWQGDEWAHRAASAVFAETLRRSTSRDPRFLHDTSDLDRHRHMQGGIPLPSAHWIVGSPDNFTFS